VCLGCRVPAGCACDTGRMTRDDADELARDLEGVGMLVEGVEPREPQTYHPGEWQVRAWCAEPAHYFTISNAARFRKAVHDGLSGVLPRGALD
jgi:hypothetical protein